MNSIFVYHICQPMKLKKEINIIMGMNIEMEKMVKEMDIVKVRIYHLTITFFSVLYARIKTNVVVNQTQ